MDVDFRQAELIELHEAGVVVHPAVYAEGIAGWREYIEEVECFTVDGEPLVHLLQALGVEPYPITEYSEKKQRHRSVQLGDMELPLIRRRRESIGGGYTSLGFSEGTHTIRELWARAESAHLLQIRFITTWEDREGGTQEEEVNLTYSGSYTVWWKEA